MAKQQEKKQDNDTEALILRAAEREFLSKGIIGARTTLLDKLREIAPTFMSVLQEKIDEEASRGLCRKVDAKMLMLDIVSLNVFAYMAAPAVNAALGDYMADSGVFLEMRKRENYDTIMRKLRP